MTSYEMFREIARTVPLFWAGAVIWLLVLACEVRLLVVARRRARPWTAADAPAAEVAPGRLVEWLAIAGPVLYMGAAMVSTMVARARVLSAFSVPATPARVTIVSDGLGGLLNAMLLPVQAVLPLALLAAYTVAVHAWARHRGLGLRVSRRRHLLAALAVVSFAVVPLHLALGGYLALLIKVAAGVAGVDPELKAVMLAKGIEEARAALDRLAVFAVLGPVGTALVIGAVWYRGAPAPLVAGGHVADGDRRALRLAAVLFVAAVLLFAAALPLRAENRVPWPSPSRSAALNVGVFEDSTLVGPDPVPWAPVLFVAASGLLVEGSPASPSRAHDVLTVLRNNYALLHPGESFPGTLNVYCASGVPAAALQQALELAADVGYRRPSLIFARPGAVSRPLLGAVPRPQISALALGTPTERGSSALPFGAGDSCGALAQRLLAGRRPAAAGR